MDHCGWAWTQWDILFKKHEFQWFWISFPQIFFFVNCESVRSFFWLIMTDEYLVHFYNQTRMKSEKNVPIYFPLLHKRQNWKLTSSCLGFWWWFCERIFNCQRLVLFTINDPCHFPIKNSKRSWQNRFFKNPNPTTIQMKNSF